MKEKSEDGLTEEERFKKDYEIATSGVPPSFDLIRRKLESYKEGIKYDDFWEKKFTVKVSPLVLDFERQLTEEVDMCLKDLYSCFGTGREGGIFGRIPYSILQSQLIILAEAMSDDISGDIIISPGIRPLYSLSIESNLDANIFRGDEDKKVEYQKLVELLGDSPKISFSANPSEEIREKLKENNFLRNSINYRALLRLGNEDDFFVWLYNPDSSPHERLRFQVSDTEIIEGFVGAFQNALDKEFLSEILYKFGEEMQETEDGEYFIDFHYAR